MDTKYLKDLYKKTKGNLNDYLVSLGLRQACLYEQDELDEGINYEKYINIPNTIFILYKSYIKDEEGLYLKYGGILINKEQYKKVSKIVEKLVTKEISWETHSKLMGKILDYPCDYTNIDYDNNDENFIVNYNYRAKKNSNLEYIYSFVCSINDKKKQLKEFKRRLAEIDKVIKPLGFKAEMEINYRFGASLDFYKTEIYKVE